MLDSYDFNTLWTQYHHHSPKDPFPLAEAINIITSYTLEESRDIVDRTDGSRGKALHPALLDLLDSAIPALQELICTASRRRWASKVYVVDPCEMNMDALRRGYTFANMNAIWADFVRRILKAEERFKQLCFPQTALATTPDTPTSQIRIQHCFRSSLKTTSSTCHVTSHALPPSSTNCRVQPAATPVAFIKTTDTKDNLMDEGKGVQGKAEKTVGKVLKVLGSVAKGDVVRSTFSTELSSLIETAPSTQTCPSAPLDTTPGIIDAVKTPQRIVPAAVAGSLAFAGFPARKESPSAPPTPVAADEDTISGRSTCTMHSGRSPAPAQAEDTSASDNVPLDPGKDPPLQPNPSTYTSDTPGAVKLETLLVSPLSPATIARPLPSVGFSSRKDVSSVPPILVAAYQEAIPGLSADPIQTGRPPAPLQAEDTPRSSNNSLSPGTAPPTPLRFSPWLDFEQGTPDVVKPPPLSSSAPGISSPPIDRSFREHNTSSEGEFGAVPQQATTNSDVVEIGLRGMVCAPSSTRSPFRLDAPSSSGSLALSNPSILSPEESSFTEITSVVSSHTSKALNFVSNTTNVLEMSPSFESSPGLPAMPIAKSSMDSRYAAPADSTARDVATPHYDGVEITAVRRETTMKESREHSLSPPPTRDHESAPPPTSPMVHLPPAARGECRRTFLNTLSPPRLSLPTIFRSFVDSSLPTLPDSRRIRDTAVSDASSISSITVVKRDVEETASERPQHESASAPPARAHLPPTPPTPPVSPPLILVASGEATVPSLLACPMHTQLSPAPVKGPPDRDKSTTSTPPHDRFVFPTIDRSFAVSRPQSHLDSFPAGTSAVPRHSAAITVVNTALPWRSWGADVKRDAHGVPERFVRPRPRSTFSISFVTPPSSPPSSTGVEHRSLKCSLSQALALSTFPPIEIDSLSYLPAQPAPNSPSYDSTPIARSFSIFNTHSQALRIPNGKVVGREKQNQGGKKTKRNDLQGIRSLTEGDTVFFTVSTEHSSPTETTPPIPPSVSAHLDPGRDIIGVIKSPPSFYSRPGLSYLPISRSFVDSYISREGEFSATLRRAQSCNDVANIGLTGMIGTLFSTRLPSDYNPPLMCGSLALSNFSTCSSEESPFTETASPISPHASTHLDSAWNAPNVVEISPSFISLPELPFMPTTRSCMASNTSNQPEFTSILLLASTNCDGSSANAPGAVHVPPSTLFRSAVILSPVSGSLARPTPSTTSGFVSMPPIPSHPLYLSTSRSMTDEVIPSPETTRKTVPVSHMSRNEAYQDGQSSSATTSSTCDVTSRALPLPTPSSTNGSAQAVKVALKDSMTFRTSEADCKADRRGKLKQGKVKMEGKGIRSVAEGDTVRFTFLTEDVSLTDTATPIQPSPSASFDTTPDVTGRVKSPSGLAPATIARALAFAGCSAGKESLSIIPMLVTACKDAVPGLLACPICPRRSPAPAQAEDTFANNNIQLVPGTEPSIHPNTSTPPASPPSSFTHVAHHSSQHAVSPVSTSPTLTPSERNVTLISHSLAIPTPPSSSAGDFSFVETTPHALLSSSDALDSTRDVPQAVRSLPPLLSLPGLLSTMTGRRSLITDASTRTACHRKSQLDPSSCGKVLLNPLGTVHMPLSIRSLSGLESSLTSGPFVLSNTFSSSTDGLSPTETAPPVQPCCSKAPNSAWDVLDAVRTPLALSSIPIDRSLVIPNTSSKAELGASPSFFPISYDCVEFGLPSGIHALSSMCLLSNHDTPSTSELLVTSFTVPKPPGFSTKPGNDACDSFNSIRIYVDLSTSDFTIFSQILDLIGGLGLLAHRQHSELDFLQHGFFPPMEYSSWNGQQCFVTV